MRIVVLGGGFAGLEAIQVLERRLGRRSDVELLLRAHLIDLSEHADHEPDPERRRAMLTICVVGGGYTGVELISDEILRGVHPTLAERARRRLNREGIEVLTRSRVTKVLPGAIEVNGAGSIPSGLTQQVQVFLDWTLAQFFPRDSAMMRPAVRCAICAAGAHAREREAA